jgi:hypothetical protein
MLLFLPLLKVTAEKQECGIFKSKLRKFTARCVTELLPDDLSTILVFFFLKKNDSYSSLEQGARRNQFLLTKGKQHFLRSKLQNVGSCYFCLYSCTLSISLY